MCIYTKSGKEKQPMYLFLVSQYMNHIGMDYQEMDLSRWGNRYTLAF